MNPLISIIGAVVVAATASAQTQFTLNITIPDATLLLLQEKATKRGVTIESLLKEQLTNDMRQLHFDVNAQRRLDQNKAALQLFPTLIPSTNLHIRTISTNKFLKPL